MIFDIDTPPTYPDDAPLFFGSDNDNVLVHRSAALATDTALTGVLEGTPVTPALPVNSLILSNTTADGDMMFATVDGGNSKSFMWMDASAEGLNLFKTSAVAGWKVQIGETVSTSSLYGQMLLVNGGVGGARVTRFQREDSGYVHNIDTRFGGGDAYIVFQRANQTYTYSIGVDAHGNGFKLDRDDALGTANKNIFVADLATTVFNEDGIDQNFRIEGEDLEYLFFVDAGVNAVGIKTSAPAALLHINQDLAAAGVSPLIPLLIEQDDVSEPIINFVGTATSTEIAQTIVDEGDATASDAGYLKIHVTNEGAGIATGAYYLTLSTLAAP